MDPVRLKQIEDIYHAALEASPEDLDSFLDESCGGDEILLREVQSLLTFDTTSGNFLDGSPGSLAAEMFANRKKKGSLINETIGHYRVISLIGEGGMGEVYLAQDEKLGRKAALKILPEEFAGDENRMGRFVLEAKSASALNHPNIITIYEINESVGVHFIATEYIDGKTLDVFAAGKPLKPAVALDFAIQIASALDEAHRAGIIHRDIKPENIMIRPDGLVKVLDFGIAKLSESIKSSPDKEAVTSIKTGGTRPGMIVGTADYMSPEQARGRSIDPRTDIFSFGAVLYEVLGGKKAFEGENSVDTIGSILHKDPVRLSSFIPNVPPVLEKIIEKALRKKVDERYQNIKDVLTDLRNVKKRLDYEDVESSFAPGPTVEIQRDQEKTLLIEAVDLEPAIALVEQELLDRKAAQDRPVVGDEAFETAPAKGTAISVKEPGTLAREDENEENPSAAHVTGEPVGTTSSIISDATRDPLLNPFPTTAEHSFPGLESTAQVTKKRIFYVLGASGLLIVALAATTFFTYFRASPISSIAVLPFVYAGDAGNDSESVSDGLADGLINSLSRLPQLKVIARTSSFRFRGENVDIQDAAQKLRVGAILTGRIVRQGDDFQISVEMINAVDNTRIWGEIYNRKVSVASKIPEEIARAVAEKLQLDLSGSQSRQMAKQITNNPQAYQFHLNGVFFRRKNGIENIKKAIEYQNQAIKLDPDFTRAYVELSINYGNLVDIQAMSPAEGLPKARAAAERALALDDTLADAYYNIARVRKYAFDWTGAETAFKKAIELNPNLAAAHTIYAEFLSQLGRFDEALREIRLAQELDPLRIGLVGNEGSIYYFARKYDEAISKKQIHVTAAPENPFAHLGLANALAARGEYAAAILSYQTSIQLEETTSSLIYLGRVYALTGRRDDAVEILNKLKTTEKYVSPAELAILDAALGDAEGALKSLEKAFAERDTQLTSLKVEPAYDPLRNDARFQGWISKIGFPE